jgi:hypothetical protein
VQATISLTGLPRRASGSAGRQGTAGPEGSPASTRALRWLGALGLFGVFTTVLLVAAGAASGPSQYVPARSGGWPNWLSGPFSSLGVGLSPDGFQALTLIMAASYLAVLLAVRVLAGRTIWVVIVAAHLVLLLGPPLISQDVFGYLDFARLGALHGMDPYTHVAAQAPTDSVYLFVGWPFQSSPYGPLFTLSSYAIAPLGLAGGLWAMKALAIATSLAAIVLLSKATGREALSARRPARNPTGPITPAASATATANTPWGLRTVPDDGRAARFTAAFVGLNPVLLELAVGGDHNDTLLLLALAAALLFTAGASPRFRAGAAALVAGIGIKVTAGLALPFLLLAPREARERLRVLTTAALSLALVAAVGLIGFGSHAFGFAGAVSEQQQLVATHSLPAETARLVGLHGTPSWWRHCFIAGFVVVFLYALWRTLRGADWRVAAGWTTLALLLATAWLLPWYAIWPLPLAAVSGDRRLRTATLVFCAYALLIHLPLANGLLSPAHITCHTLKDCVRGGGFRLGSQRVHFTRLQVPGHVALDLRR